MLKTNENCNFSRECSWWATQPTKVTVHIVKNISDMCPKFKKIFGMRPRNDTVAEKKDTPATKELWGKIVFFKRTWLLLRERYPQFHFCPLVPLLRASKRGASLFSSSTGVEMGSRQSLNFSFSCDLCSKTDVFSYNFKLWTTRHF